MNHIGLSTVFPRTRTHFPGIECVSGAKFQMSPPPSRFILSLWLSLMVGCAASCLLLTLNLVGGNGDKDAELVVAVSSAASVVTFGLSLLW